MDSITEETQYLRDKLIKKAEDLIRTHDEGLKRIPGFNISVIRENTDNRSCFYTLSLAIILQGEKIVDVGDQQYQYGAGSMIVTSVEIPTSFRIINASQDKPFVSMSIKLNLRMLSEIMAEIQDKKTFSDPEDSNAFCLAKTTPEILDCFDRLIRLSEHPEHSQFMIPSVIRELHYFALSDKQCSNLRELCTNGMPNNRISKAVEWIKDHYKEPMRIQDLADMTFMASSTFHTHFKKVTSLTPLQYQKRLRLHEAKRLMIFDSYNASSAAFEVGYESVQQFTREYKRLFGLPPLKDVNNS